MFYVVNTEPKIIIDKSHNSFCTDKCLKEVVDGRLQCKCGEDIAVFDWSWQNLYSPNIRIFNEGREVLFHPVYSSGTAAVRGQIPFQQNYHYYWEIKIISKLYGTDVMIGVGTSKVILEDWQFKFCSLLGIDSESWGYSFNGSIQHNKLKRKYGLPFGSGSIIGVHLDMCNGTLEYFLNRIPLGVAFRDLKGKELYPMVCSTAALSAIRITCCMSKEASLQMMCLKCIMKHPSLYNEYKNIPGLSRIYDRQLFWMQPQLPKEADEKKRLAELDEEVTLSLVNRSYVVKNKKFRAIRLISLLYDNELEKKPGHSNLGVYDLCDLDLDMENVDQTDGPSTSRGNSNAPDGAKSSKNVPVCFRGHSGSKDCDLRRSLDDSDTDTDTPGLSQIL